MTKLFGMEYLHAAEDIVSDTFLQAAETWGLKGIPQNPTAWLYSVSKNKAIDFLRHSKLFNAKVAPALKYAQAAMHPIEIDLSNENIRDTQLQMMFAICHPAISPVAQIGLSLNLLCGFGVEEIADAFLTNKETIYKRLKRAKEKLRAGKVKIEMPPPAEIDSRLDTVLTTLYLLFSEGYYSTSQNTTLRKDFCLEAMRLNLMLLEYQHTNTPAANALLSLMCFHSSRFDARIDKNGEIVLYEEQDEKLWNKELIAKGEYYLNQASRGKQVTKYHLEAAIAYWHTQKEDSVNKWENILQLYNRLLQLEYSPIAALNRTYALSKANSKQEAIIEAEKLQLKHSHLYYSLLAHLYMDSNKAKSIENLEHALRLAKTEQDRRVITQSIAKHFPGTSLH
ncbi:RNA polymerase sigma factor [Flavihumibacter profundi]|uniref:RNA polymerase sigma factor n=1 Tax=Flavihumibacter profundi TaxID=2716883 RepID=UPI003742294E